jgi:hypothetical protein
MLAMDSLVSSLISAGPGIVGIYSPWTMSTSNRGSTGGMTGTGTTMGAVGVLIRVLLMPCQGLICPFAIACCRARIKVLEDELLGHVRETF